MEKEVYIKRVLSRLHAPRKIKKRVSEDLNERIDQALESDPFYNLEEEMGSPFDVAREFMENLDMVDPASVIIGGTTKAYEYISKQNIFGLPLVHVNTGGRNDTRVAKGIIAVGDIAIGVVSVGGISTGLISIGGVSLGGLAIGGVAIGAAAFGGVAIGLFAIGGVAISLFKAFGALPFIIK